MKTFLTKVGEEFIIISDEEIKEGDLVNYLNVIIECLMCDEDTIYFMNGTKAKRVECKKVLASSTQREGLAFLDMEQQVRVDRKEFTKINLMRLIEWFGNDYQGESYLSYDIIEEFPDLIQTISLKQAYENFTNPPMATWDMVEKAIEMARINVEFTRTSTDDKIKTVAHRTRSISEIISSLKPKLMPVDCEIVGGKCIVTIK